MTDAGPRQMVDERRHALGCEHVHDLDARLDALLGIGVLVQSDGTVWTTSLFSASGIFGTCSLLINDTTTMSHTAYLSMSLIQKGWAADILVPWGATGVCERARRGSWFLRVRGSRV